MKNAENIKTAMEKIKTKRTEELMSKKSQKENKFIEV